MGQKQFCDSSQGNLTWILDFLPPPSLSPPLLYPLVNSSPKLQLLHYVGRPRFSPEAVETAPYLQYETSWFP